MSVVERSDSVSASGRRLVERARWGVGFLVAILSLTANVVMTRVACADDWVMWMDRGHHCSDGIECALADWNYFVSLPPQKPWVLERCGFQYNNPNAPGQYVAVCSGSESQPHEYIAHDAIALLSCADSTRMGATGCIRRPPPDQRRMCQAEAANPVDIRSGTKREYRLDFSTAGEQPLKFERYYTSNQDSMIGNLRETRLGRGWRSNFDSKFNYSGDSSMVFVLPSGELLYFSSSGSVFTQQHYSWDTNSLVAGARGQVAGLVQDSTSGNYILTTNDNRKWTYNFFGKLQTIVYPGGYTQTLIYDANDRNTEVVDSFGRSLSFAYSSGGLLQSVTVPGGQVYRYAYHPRNAALAHDADPPDLWALEYVIEPDATADDADNPRIRYHYENTADPYALTGITDERGVRHATWSYGADGRVATSEHAGGIEHYTFAYDDIANTVTVTNPASKATVYRLAKSDGTQSNLLTQIDGQPSANCAASTSQLAYNSNDLVVDEIDAEGRVTHTDRDNRGNPTAITRGSGTASAQTTSYAWHPTFNLPTTIAEPGVTTEFSWNAMAQLTQVTQTDTTSQTVPYSTNGQTRTWTYTYGSAGQLLTVDGPLSGAGDTVVYTYDSSGFLATITNEVNQITTVNAVNSRGQPTSVTDPNGVVTALAYDLQGRVTTMTVDPLGQSAVTAIAYNAVGDITRIMRPNGAYLQFAYDDGRRLIGVQDNNGSSIEYDRDSVGNATARRIKDSSGSLQLSQTAVFDELGRLLKYVGASNQTWTNGYDRTDNRVSITDPRSNVFGWTFDALNRLVKRTDEESNVVTLTRNGSDEITGYSDPRSLSTTFVRDGFGDVIQRVSPDTGTTVYIYNALGLPIQITDGRGVITNLTYDSAGRLLTKQYPAASTENLTYDWDSTVGGNIGIGRNTRIIDSSGSVEWTYNMLGQVTQEKKTTGGAIYSVGYGYDLDGSVTKIIYPSGRTVRYYRGVDGLITTVTQQPNAAGAEALLAKWITYQPFGPLQSLVYGNDLVLWKTFTQDYNLNTLVVEQGSNSIISRAYTYWYNDFDITNIWDNNVSTRTDNYVFTPNHRLQNVYGDWGAQTYWQDSVGNRTGDAFDDGATTTTRVLGYPYNSNLYVSTTEGAATLRAVTNDGAGNMITDLRGTTAYHYRYNNRGRLDQLTIGATVTANYEYDGLERMSARTTQNMVPAGTTHYIYDQAGHLLAETSGVGTTQREYIWIDDMPLAMFADLDTTSPKQWYVHSDHLDRPSKMTDASQNVVWDAYYWPYGATRSITGIASNNLRLPGQYYLAESGLYYNWFRHYDATVGRYTQADPIGLVGGPSLYLYASGNPVSGIDPLGLRDWNEQETRAWLAKAYGEASAGRIQGLINIYNNSKGNGPYDFGWNSGTMNDTWKRCGVTMDADHFANFMAGFQGGAYDREFKWTTGLWTAEASVRVAGFLYHVAGLSKAKNDWSGATGRPMINAGEKDAWKFHRDEPSCDCRY